MCEHACKEHIADLHYCSLKSRDCPEAHVGHYNQYAINIFSNKRALYLYDTNLSTCPDCVVHHTTATQHHALLELKIVSPNPTGRAPLPLLGPPLPSQTLSLGCFPPS
eukprot:2500489-Pleurochrysis_carterae.AAC.1